MKKTLLMVLLFCLSLQARAVELPNQGFGLQIGWAQPILRLNEPNYSLEQKDSLGNVVKLNGIKIGLVYDASYIAGFGSTMGINYTFAAAHTPWKSDNIYGMPYPRHNEKYFYNEVEVFVDWQYKFEVAKETYLMLYTGPSIQCGISFTERTNTQEQIFDEIVTTTQTYKLYGGNEDENPDKTLKRLNVTWGVGAGFQYKRYFLRGGYDFGLLVPYKNADFSNERHTRGRLDQWSIKVGMYLWYDED